MRVFDTGRLIPLSSMSTSKGNQRKWYEPEKKLYIKEQFWYQGKYWRDDLVECIAAGIAEQMNTGSVVVIKQKPCMICENGIYRHGVYSADFTSGDKRFVSLYRLLAINRMEYEMTNSVEANWYFVRNFLNRFLETDITEYLLVMSLLDYLLGNEDRHLNNLGLLESNHLFIQAPLFDFGLGLFEHDRRYEGESFRKCLQLMQCKPFASDNQELMNFLVKEYDINQYIPPKLDLSEYEIPSPKAGSYLRNRCLQLGIKLKGVD